MSVLTTTLARDGSVDDLRILLSFQQQNPALGGIEGFSPNLRSRAMVVSSKWFC